MDVRTVNAAQSYASSKPATKPDTSSATIPSQFTDFATALKQAEDTAKAAMVGDADPHSLVQALAQTELAVEAAVTIRNKVVEAYQEILRMPV